MTSHYQDDQFLRQMFDAIYAFRPRRTAKQIEGKIKTHQRLFTYIAIGAIAVVTWLVLLMLMSSLFNYIAWQNRPSFDERMAAPYNIVNRNLPIFDPAQYLLTPLTVGNYNMLMEDAKDVTPVFPGQCLMSEGLENACDLAAQPDYSAHVFYLNAEYVGLYETLKSEAVATVAGDAVVENAEGALETAESMTLETLIADNAVNVTAAHFTTVSDAVAAFESIYTEMNNAGQVNNFSLMESQPVHYFYGIQNRQYTFAWQRDTFIYIATASNFSNLDTVMQQFPF